MQQIAWWAGDVVEKSMMRGGQASRRGYVVIAPQWQRPQQAEYEYSFREHAAVIYTLRDACRRISIDTDSVFLSGHFTGGDAAWDIALAHPDLWAGCVMIAPRGDRYVKYYRDNARQVPLYFVSGEKYAGPGMDSNWLMQNATELDRYLSDTRTDCTLVLYQGRGRDREGFSDEIQRIFEWMALGAHRRNFDVNRIDAVSMRPWDSYFWWLECEGFPPRTMVLPQAWPQPGARVVNIHARIIEKTGRIEVSPASSRATIWLSPEIIDFDRPIQVVVNGRELREEIKPSVDVILEDVRTRGDRQHPFWARVDWPESRSRKR
jgi:pimeloyl-ACP methyl ester carboxylesterase